MSVECPFCLAKPNRPCRSIATGRFTKPHHIRKIREVETMGTEVHIPYLDN